MNAPTPPADADKSPPVELDVEAEMSKLLGQEIPKCAPKTENQESPKPAPKIENNPERIRSAVARLTSSSIDNLKGLTSELQQLQEFLKSEVGRVESEIESVLAGINIIVETIAPWQNTEDSQTPPAKNACGVRAGPAANIISASLQNWKAPA